MHILRQFISRFRDSLVLYLYLIIASGMLLSSDSQIVDGLRNTSLYSFGFVQNIFSGIDNYFSLKKENQYLRKENTKLAYENFQLQNALLENIRLQELLDFRQNSPYSFTPAKIIGSSPLNFVSGFLIATKNDSLLDKNLAVMTSNGLVGKIIKVSGNKAICQSLFDANSRVSVRVQRNRELGIVTWDGSRGLFLENISNTIEIFKGDVLYTSGMSRTFPADIKVGIVTSVKKNERELFQTIRVKPAVNFNNLEELLIIQPEEKDEI